MEMEANKKEYISLESQLTALNKHIDDLTSELDSQRTKVLTKSDINSDFLEENRIDVSAFLFLFFRFFLYKNLVMRSKLNTIWPAGKSRSVIHK